MSDLPENIYEKAFLYEGLRGVLDDWLRENGNVEVVPLRYESATLSGVNVWFKWTVMRADGRYIEDAPVFYGQAEAYREALRIAQTELSNKS